MDKLRNLLLVPAVALTSGACFAAEGSGGVAEAVKAQIGIFQTDTTATITTIGVALISVAAVGLGIKWAKAAMFS
ncbi:hypothetical protein [Photobacterium piscicola]|uniref:Major coat protein n=1 Tax=Photobacterium piscicola TaxID=1378299 RepID=A0ABU6LDH9_9GAMM|nr:hypothetical protein [Photobacterium piscicola]